MTDREMKQEFLLIYNSMILQTILMRLCQNEEEFLSLDRQLRVAAENELKRTYGGDEAQEKATGISK